MPPGTIGNIQQSEKRKSKHINVFSAIPSYGVFLCNHCALCRVCIPFTLRCQIYQFNRLNKRNGITKRKIYNKQREKRSKRTKKRKKESKMKRTENNILQNNKWREILYIRCNNKYTWLTVCMSIYFQRSGWIFLLLLFFLFFVFSSLLLGYRFVCWDSLRVKVI